MRLLETDTSGTVLLQASDHQLLRMSVSEERVEGEIVEVIQQLPRPTIFLCDEVRSGHSIALHYLDKNL